MKPEPVVAVHGLTKTYSPGLLKKGVRALDDVSLEVERGTVFGLLGPNGAGKTTLVKVLLGLARGYRGEARLCGRRAGASASRRSVGYLPESHRLPPYLTGRQVLEVYGMLSGRSVRWLRARIPAWLERVQMSGTADRKVRTYSKGMQQRIGVAQALVHEPEVVFLDEPTDGVDPEGRRTIRETIGELRARGVTVFVNSHLLLEVELMCDRVAILDGGRVVDQGTIEDLTPRTGIVRFEVDRVPDDLELLLPDGRAANRLGDGAFEALLDDAEQNALIDGLRARRVAIRAVQPRRATLEESFIDLVRARRSAS